MLMHCKLELDERQIPVLGLLHNLMTESLNELGFSIAENLTAYSLIRTFTIIKTIKSISEDIIKSSEESKGKQGCIYWESKEELDY